MQVRVGNLKPLNLQADPLRVKCLPLGPANHLGHVEAVRSGGSF